MKSKFRLNCRSQHDHAVTDSLDSCSNDDLLEANINKLPENAIGFNVTRQDAWSYDDSENSFIEDDAHIRKQSFLTRDTNQELILSLNKDLLQIKYSIPTSDLNTAINEDLGIGDVYEKSELKPLTYKTGSNVKLVNRVEQCKSVIADGKELIVTGRESGELIVPELKDENVYITFKDGLTEFSITFYECASLQSIPENLFANCPLVESFWATFSGCTSIRSIPENLFAHSPNVTNFRFAFSRCNSLTEIPDNLFTHNPNVTTFAQTFFCCTSIQSIPAGLFDNNKKVTSFQSTFRNCTSLTGESPYTMVNGKKVHLYERRDHTDEFTKPYDNFESGYSSTFCNCISLTDYAQILSSWK